MAASAGHTDNARPAPTIPLLVGVEMRTAAVTVSPNSSAPRRVHADAEGDHIPAVAAPTPNRAVSTRSSVTSKASYGVGSPEPSMEAWVRVIKRLMQPDSILFRRPPSTPRAGRRRRGGYRSRALAADLRTGVEGGAGQPSATTASSSASCAQISYARPEGCSPSSTSHPAPASASQQ
jgi:hypothetical protein